MKLNKTYGATVSVDSDGYLVIDQTEGDSGIVALSPHEAVCISDFIKENLQEMMRLFRADPEA